jgi:anhydro-N-acetylmuramic acid kinase
MTKATDSSTTIYIGCMTGTSVDDYCDFTASQFSKTGELRWHQNYAHRLPQQLQQDLLRASQAPADAITLRQRNQLQADLTDFLAQAYAACIEQLPDRPQQTLILSPHGQTIEHQVLSPPYYTDQLVNGPKLAALTGYPVVSGHRQAAIAQSHAAPLAPVLLQQLFQSNEHNTVIINGGGIANVCYLSPGEPIIAHDIGPANAPLDSIIEHILKHDPKAVPTDFQQSISCYDKDGQWAAKGNIIAQMRDALLSTEALTAVNRKSFDRVDFNYAWVKSAMKQSYSWADILCTVVDVITTLITNDIKQHLATNRLPTEVLLYGGMLHNQFLIAELKKKIIKNNLEINCQSLDHYGFDADFIESLLMAYLGFCVHHNKPIDLSYCAFNPAQTVRVIPGQIATPA